MAGFGMSYILKLEATSPSRIHIVQMPGGLEALDFVTFLYCCKLQAVDLWWLDVSYVIWLQKQ
jgi:hypothetical protein